MKNCSKCKELKPLEEFSKNKNTPDNRQNRCKKCSALYKRELYNLNPQKHIDDYLKYYHNNKEQVDIVSKNYKLLTKEQQKIYNNNYTQLNKDKKQKASTKWAQNNKEHIKLHIKNRRNNDSSFKLSGNIRALIYGSFKKVCKGQFSKSKSTEEILGCTIEEFINYLQSQFTEGMTLENHGEWEMDHIVPVSSAKVEEEICMLNHYTNFQPLWKEDNRKKGNKIN